MCVVQEAVGLGSMCSSYRNAASGRCEASCLNIATVRTRRNCFFFLSLYSSIYEKRNYTDTLFRV